MNKDKEILLTISILVSGREDTTLRCLDSLVTLMQEIPSELILVDTGCSQKFRNKLLEYTHHIISFEWCNDFSKARNVGLQHAKGKWFLYLDDDEWFVETDELIDFFKSGEYKEYHRANYIQRNFQDALLTYYSDSWVSRIIRIEPDTHFESKIHEYLAPARGKCKNLKAVANHTGYIFQTEEDKLRHFERNSVLLLEMIKEEPQRLRWKVQLVQEYRGIKAWNDLYTFSAKCLEETKQMNSPIGNRDIGTFYVGAVEGLLFLKNNEEAEYIANQGLNDTRLSMLCKSHLLLQLGVVYFREEKLLQSEKALLQFLDNYKYMMEHEEELQEQQGVLLVEEAFDDVSVKKAYSILCCCGLKQGNTDYLKLYYEKLQWEKRVIYVCDDFPPVLMEAMGSLPIEDIFVSVWKDVWKNSELRNMFVQYIEEQRKQNTSAFNQLMRVAAKADVEAAYTLYEDIVLAEWNGSVQPIEFEALRERFASFSNQTLGFLKRYYKPIVFEEYAELLPIYGQVALLLEEALRLEKTDLHKALEKYREVVSVDAAYANVISGYIRMLGDEFSTRNTQNEMEELKENVLQKVYEKVKERQFEEALTILMELKKVIPDDLNIAMMSLEIRLSLLQ